MGIIEEVEQLSFLLPRMVARLRELEEGPGSENQGGPCPLAPTVTGLLRRIEALEAREEARGRLEAEAVPPGSPPAPPTDMASRCAGCGGFIRVEGARCGVCRGGAPDLTAVIQPLREAAPEPKPSFGHCLHTPCCHCAGGDCLGEGASPNKPGLTRDCAIALDDDQRYSDG